MSSQCLLQNCSALPAACPGLRTWAGVGGWCRRGELRICRCVGADSRPNRDIIREGFPGGLGGATMTVMTTQPPLPLIPTGATEIGAAAAMIEDERRGPGLCARAPGLRLGCRRHRWAPVRGGVVDADQGGHPGAGRGRVRHLPVDPLAVGAGAVDGGGQRTGPAPQGAAARLQTHPRGDRHDRGAARAGPVAAGDRRAGRGLGGQRPQSTVRHRHRDRDRDRRSHNGFRRDRTRAEAEPETGQRFRRRTPTPRPRSRSEAEADRGRRPVAEPDRDRCRVRCRCWPIRSIGAASGRWRRSG